MTLPVLFALAVSLSSAPLGPGDHLRKMMVDGRERSYLIHIPPQYASQQPTPVVLVFHGAGMNAAATVAFTGMSTKSDQAGFIAVYPNGTGIDPFLTLNAGGRRGTLAEHSADDVKYVAHLLDDLIGLVPVDPKRVFATGMSNGGMMCYRLAAELSDRIAAIAPVAGTMAIDEAKPKRPIAVLHFHGTSDKLVPVEGPGKGTPKFLTFKSVAETIRMWCQIDQCPPTPTIVEFPNTADDGTTVTQQTYGPGKEGTEVVLVEIEGGGHTWPGQTPAFNFLGKSTHDISANDLIWQFFQKHPMK